MNTKKKLSNKLEVFPAAPLGEEEEKKKNKCPREGKKKKKERLTVRKERDWGKLGIEVGILVFL